MKFLQLPRLLSFAAALTVSVIAACTNTSVTGPTETTAKCQVALSVPQQALSANGGSGSLSVIAAAECQWTAATDAAWISGFSPASGQGPAQVGFAAAANPAGEARQAEIRVNDAAARVTQEPAPCTFDVTPRTVTVGAGAGRGVLTITTPPGCTWTARADVTWLTLVSSSQSIGPGSLTFDVETNPGSLARIGSLTVAGTAVLVTQQAPGCSYALSPASQTVTAAGGAASVTVAAGPSCNWTVASDVPWITLNAAQSGTGNALLPFTVAPNTGARRTGQVLVAGAIATVTQDAAATCVVTLLPPTQTVGAGGGAASVALNAGPSCSWTAASNVPWITLNASPSGTGSATLPFTVATNTGGSRTGQVTVGAAVAIVTQDAATNCALTIAPSTQTVPAGGGGASVVVTVGSSCSWTASSDVSWITVSPGAGGTGNATLPFTVAPNTGASRSGRVLVGSAAATVTQDAVGNCTFTVSPTTHTLGTTGGTFGVSVATTAACSWTAGSTDSWVQVVPVSGVGPGTAQVSVAANTGPARSSTGVTIAGQLVTIVQAPVTAPACTYTLTPSSAAVGSGTGGGSIAVATQANCAWAASSTTSTWLQISGGVSGVGPGTVAWTHDVNSGTAERTGSLVVAGQTFTVVQTGAPPSCMFTINPQSASFDDKRASGTIQLTSSHPSCAWTAATSASWVDLTPTSGVGSGQVRYEVDRNHSNSPRTATIVIGGRTFNVVQDN